VALVLVTESICKAQGKFF